ncbi:MAG TPA: sugar transferase [Kofleriaceae bacterium]|nr:sugar transferase [Kofleriaceae bacterium]
MRQAGAHLIAKKALDKALGAAALGLLSPVIAASAIAIRFTMGSPVMFSQERAGRGGRRFRITKFRSMNDRRDASGALLPDAERLTRFGQFLRSSSIDELPQLWSVLRGDMSLVGPRPLPIKYLERYSAEQARRHEVLPGITGWAQVNGRNAHDWEVKLAFDTWYVENWSLALDVTILAKTVMRVLARRDISQPGHATMPEFFGAAEQRGDGRRAGDG